MLASIRSRVGILTEPGPLGAQGTEEAPWIEQHRPARKELV